MIGELVRREAEIAVAPLTITAEREKVFQKSVGFSFRCNQKILQSYVSNNFYAPKTFVFTGC